MSNITTTCVHCNRVLRLNAKFLEKSIRCPKCDQVFKVSNVAFTPAGSPEASQEALVTRSQPTPARKFLQQPASQVGSEADPISNVEGHAGAPQPKRTLNASTIGRYEVTKELGRGAFGVVYAARDPVLKRAVAIKVQGQTLTETETSKLVSEAQAAARLRHPNLVAVFEVGTEEGRPFVVSELIDGKSLADRIADGVFPAEKAATLIRDLARGLAYAHSQGLIHRDMKPHNILVGEDGRPQIADFGLAVDRRDEEQARQSAYSRSGTLAYMAPEQAGIGGASVGPAVDQYALGATFFEMLTGKRPHEGSSIEILKGLEAEHPPRVRTQDSKISIDLDAICFKAMAREPWNRYEDCDELADDLDRYLAGDLIRGRRIGLIERARHYSRRHPAIAAWTAGAAIALIGITFATTVVAVRNVILVRQIDAEKNRLIESLATQSRELNGDLNGAPNEKLVDAGNASPSSDLPLWIAYSRKLNKSVRAAAIGDSELSHKLLEETRPEFRQWEYAHLDTNERGLIAKFTLPATTQGRSLHALSDGQSFVVRDNQSVRRIRLQDGQELAAWQDAPPNASNYPIVCMRHSPQVLCGVDKRIVGWNYETGKSVPSIELQIACTKLLLSPDDRWLLAMSRQGEYDLWDLKEFKRSASEIASGQSFDGLTSPVFADDSNYFQAIRTGGASGAQLFRKDLLTTAVHSLPSDGIRELFHSGNSGQSLAFSNGADNWQMKFTESYLPLTLTAVYPNRPRTVIYRKSLDSGHIAVVADHQLKLYVDGRVDNATLLLDEEIDSIDVSPDGRIVIASYLQDVLVWDTNAAVNHAASQPVGMVINMSLSAQGLETVVCAADGTVSLINSSSGDKLWEKNNGAN